MLHFEQFRKCTPETTPGNPLFQISKYAPGFELKQQVNNAVVSLSQVPTFGTNCHQNCTLRQ